MSDIALLDKLYPHYSLDEAITHINNVVIPYQGEWILINEPGTEELGRFKTREDAIRQELLLRQSQINPDSRKKMKVQGTVIPRSEYEKDLSPTELGEIDELLDYPIN